MAPFSISAWNVSSSTLRIETPRAFAPLLKPSRYKGLWGGRGGGKSHFFAEAMVERCFIAPTRCVCIREVQKSIKESAYQLIVDKIHKFKLTAFFQILENEIRSANGSLIIFRGMQSFNAINIKSLEGFDIAWWEEAAAASARAWKMLRPTIRKPGSEIWCSWNPEDEDDPVDVFFRGPNKRKGAICIKVGWEDNPWFDTVLRDEMEGDYAADFETAEHVWGGEYEKITEGAYYARHMSEVEKSGRVANLPYDPALPVITSWDIGVDDYTAVWFYQINGRRIHALDYHEFSGMGPQDIIPECLPELLPTSDIRRAENLTHLGRGNGWRYGKHYLPHDVQVREWGAGAITRIQILQGLGMTPIIKGARQGPAERIQATRQILPLVWFDEERTHLGRKRLRRYRRSEHSTTGQFGQPLKDGNDHAADAFGEFAVNCSLRPTTIQPPKRPRDAYAPMKEETADGWKVA